MPKTHMDYSKTNIYKIVCNDLTIRDCYVGHTTNMTERKHNHKSRCHNEKNRGHNFKIYKIIRENGGWDNWNMVLVEKFPCKDKFEACKREREIFEELDAKMNTKRPYTTQEERNQYLEEHKEDKKQYYQEHKEQLQQNHKQYQQEHKAEIAEKKKQYQQEHKAEIAEKRKQYYQEHKAELQQNHKQYYQERKAERKQYSKQYREEHKAEIKELAEKLKEKAECEYCAKRLSKGYMSHHIKICKYKPVKE